MVKALYNGLNWLATNKDQLGEVFTRIAESLPALNTAYVPGSTDPNAFQNKVLDAMKSAAPLFLSFLASQFGLNKLPTALKKAIGYVPKKIENALRKGLQSFAKKAGGGTAVKEKNASLTTNKNNSDEFAYNGKQYRLVVAAESKGGTTIKIVDKETSKPVGKPLKEEHFTTAEAKQEFRELANKADDLRIKAKKPLAGQPRANVAALKPLQADVNKERGDLLNEHYIGKCVFLNAGCFAAGTKLWTPQGYRNIEDIRPGERVYSRDQWDEDGEIVAKIVEEVFERYTTVLGVLADGREIRTTGEHPFFVKGKGWTPANELRVGDKLVCAESGQTVTVEAIRDTGERELVYNLRVSDFHTYFVGGDDWGWAAWAHNIYLKPVTTQAGTVVIRIQKDANTPAEKPFVSSDWQSSVETLGGARTFTGVNALQDAIDAVRPINKLAVPFTDALKDHYTEAVLRLLFTKYSGDGYKGDFSKIEGNGVNEDETEKTAGRDALFDALVYPPPNGTTRGGRRPITFTQAKTAFAAITTGASLTGDDQWLAPEPQTDAAIAAVNNLLPTNQQGGYGIPVANKTDPDAIVRAQGNGYEPHIRAAVYERALAYQIHKGEEPKFAEHAGIVIWWGDYIGSGKSADAISINPTTGQVTLWDSKAYANGSPNIQSDTFKGPDLTRRETARQHAEQMINDFAWKSEDETGPDGLKVKALASIAVNTGNYKMITVWYKPVTGPDIFKPVKLNETPNA